MDIYEIVTDRIVKELEKGVVPWEKPWIGSDGAVKHSTGESYSLLNQMLLGKSGEWLSYKQALAEGGCVKKGEKGSIVVFWTFLDKKTDKLDKDGNPIIEKIPFLKYYTVFHIDQCEGIKPKWNKERFVDNKPLEEAQRLFDDYTTRENIKVHTGDKAFYRPSDDSITLPALDTFKIIEEYYSTAYHEAIHSTGAKERLNRDGIVLRTGFGSENYSKEELVAEIGACVLLNKVGIENKKTFQNNTAYIDNWLGALRNDKRFIVSASSKAEKAVKYFLGEIAKEETAKEVA